VTFSGTGGGKGDGILRLRLRMTRVKGASDAVYNVVVLQHGGFVDFAAFGEAGVVQ
jgi:hypothetical protein